MAEVLEEKQPQGQVYNIYHSVKERMPDITQYQKTQYYAGLLDSVLTNLTKNCDHIIGTGLNAVKTVTNKLPTTIEVTKYVSDKSN